MKTVGDYEYYEKPEIGRGAFGIVYKGRNKTVRLITLQDSDQNLAQVVAIKEVDSKSHKLKSHPDAIKRETEILKKQTDLMYFVMEFCNGGNLQKYLESEQKLDESTIRIFLRQIAAGLKVAHDLHIVHRDLKPENIMLCFSGSKCPSPDNITLKIADFGIGRFLDDDEMSRTLCGTPLYMAPEILLHRPGGYDYKVDLWSVGVIAYECLVGSLPQDLLIAVREFQNPKNATEDFTNLLQGLLEKDENKRFTLKQVFDHQFIGKKPEHEYKPNPQKTNTSTVTVKPPASFKPIPIQEKDTAPKPAVPPKPFKDTSIFQNVDTHAYGLVGEVSPARPMPIPTLPPGYLGPQPNFKKLGLSTVKNVDPYIQTDIGEIQVEFSTTQPLCITSKLIHLLGSLNDYRSDYILQQSKGGNVILFLKLLKIGFYKFQVYALPFSDTSEDLSDVYNYLISCTNTQATLVSYPKQYSQWKEDGCYLHEPLEGKLQRNRKSKGRASTLQHYYFKIDVPKADSVAVVIGEDWMQLKLKPSGSWEGEVNMEKHWGHESKVAICAHCENEASYNTLLEYSM